MFKKLPENTKMMINSFGPLTAVVILFFLAGNFGFSKISDVRANVKKIQADRNVLTQKLNLIRGVSQTAAAASSVASVALPASNPALTVSAQLKLLASQNGVLLSGFKAGGEAADASGLSRADLTFDVTGSRPGVIAFIKGIKTFAPITLVDKIKINEAGGSSKATFSVKSFWSAFPKTLPAITEPIADLTADERKTLQDISTLTQPLFSEETVVPGGGKTDPFAK